MEELELFVEKNDFFDDWRLFQESFCPASESTASHNSRLPSIHNTSYEFQSRQPFCIALTSFSDQTPVKSTGFEKNGSYEYKLLYSGQLSPVARLNANDEIVEQYVYGTRVNVPDYMIKDGRKYRILTDHKGSVRMVVDTHNWEIVQQTEYSPFGMIIDEQLAEGWEPVLFGYAGGLQDRDTGLVRFGARDYDPEVGRWTSKEPLGFNGASNFYIYAGNDPVNYVDVTGLKPFMCDTLLETVISASDDIISLYNDQSYEMQEYGTIIFKRGVCYFYSTIKIGNNLGPTMGAINLGNLFKNAKKEVEKLFPGAIPIASLHNHPDGGTVTTHHDNSVTAEKGIVNITLLRGPDHYAIKTTRGARKDKPFPKEVVEAYRILQLFHEPE